MTTEEANKIIAEFMGGSDLQIAFTGMYSHSLDTLVPVWDKMNENRVTLEHFGNCSKGYSADLNLSHNYETYSNTIQEAAAIATAKAIKELKNE